MTTGQTMKIIRRPRKATEPNNQPQFSMLKNKLNQCLFSVVLEKWLMKTLVSPSTWPLVSASPQDVFKQATEDRLTSAKELPYFEGDFWPNVLEESIKELEQEEEERKKEENTASTETPEVSWIEHVESFFSF